MLRTKLSHRINFRDNSDDTNTSKIAIVVAFCKIPIYLNDSKTPLISLSVSSIDNKNVFFITAVYKFPLVLFEHNIFTSFLLKNLHHYKALVFITFLFLTFVCEPEISRRTHRDVFPIIMAPVKRGRENTYEDVILQGIL